MYLQATVIPTLVFFLVILVKVSTLLVQGTRNNISERLDRSFHPSDLQGSEP